MNLKEFLKRKAKKHCKTERQEKAFIENFINRYNEVDFDIIPNHFLNSATKDFPSGIYAQDLDRGAEILTVINLLAELEVDPFEVELNIILFVKNKIMPHAFDYESDFIIGMLESIAWSLAELGTKKSLHLLDMIVTSSIIEKSDNYNHTVSACLYAYKMINDRELLSYFLRNYSKIKDGYLHNKEAIVEKIEYYSKHDMISKKEYFSYLLYVNNILENEKER